MTVIKYTQEQLEHIKDYGIAPQSINVSFVGPSQPLLVDFLILLENEGRKRGFSDRSDFFREAARCLLHFGLDWRNVLAGSDNGKLVEKLNEISAKIDNIKHIAATGSIEEVQEELSKFDIDDTETFFK